MRKIVCVSIVLAGYFLCPWGNKLQSPARAQEPKLSPTEQSNFERVAALIGTLRKSSVADIEAIAAKRAEDAKNGGGGLFGNAFGPREDLTRSIPKRNYRVWDTGGLVTSNVNHYWGVFGRAGLIRVDSSTMGQGGEMLSALEKRLGKPTDGVKFEWMKATHPKYQSGTRKYWINSWNVGGETKILIEYTELKNPNPKEDPIHDGIISVCEVTLSDILTRAVVNDFKK